ncbi:MAG TPA: trigger factor [Candidatus Paceibacterota bacterium]|jgi:FKBP-type peptidyl-prolyl cis-trans isomerase (trigger factor)|nr:trigger factor [Candidatus Paceibacterota bacterium]
MSKQYTATVTNLPDSKVEIKGEVAWDTIASYEKKAFDHLAGHLEVDGFRKGKVPEDVARKQIPDMMILNDMAEQALQDLYPSIIKDNDLDIIGRPELAITKIARNSAVEFTIRATILPTIELPDYKKIAKDITEETAAEVTDEDVTKVVEELRQLRAYGHVHGEGEDHGHTEDLPEVDDAFAQSFGEFKDVADMRAKITENLKREKEHEAKDKRRIGIMEAIVEKTDFVIPAIVIQSEQEKMLAQIEADISRAGFTLDDYLKQSNKTKEGLLADFKPESEKRARVQLVLNAISRKENIIPSDEEVKAETERLLAMYPGADEARTIAYVDMMLTNEKTLSLLEGK